MRNSFVAVLAVAPLLVLPGAAHHARTCTAGVIQYEPVAGPPGVISSKWNSNGCHQFQSPELLDTGGGTHYGNQWTTTVGVISTASSPNALAKAWIRYKNSASGQHYCERVYPTKGSSFFSCD